MRKQFSLPFFTFCLCSFLLIKCQESEETVPNSQPQQVSISKRFAETISENQELIRTDSISLSSFISGESNDEIFKSSSLKLTAQDLNYLLEGSINGKAIAIVSFSKVGEDRGYLIYELEDSSLFVNVHFPNQNIRYKVNGVFLEDILYIQKEECQGCDFIMLRGQADFLDYDDLLNQSSDLRLAIFRDGNFIRLSNGKYRIRKVKSDLQMSAVQENSFFTGFCGVTHWCMRGEGPHCDTWRAICVTLNAYDCAYESMVQYERANKELLGIVPMIYDITKQQIVERQNDHSYFALNLPTQGLYDVQAAIKKTLAGSLYVDTYYALSSHFKQTLNLSIGIDIISISKELSELSNRYISGENEILLDDYLYAKIVRIVNKSKLNSSSSIYKETMDIMIHELGKYKNKKVKEVRLLLNKPY